MKKSYSLRRTLLTAIVLLIAVLSAAIGAFSTFALENRLVERLDAQLVTATDRSFERFVPEGVGPTPPENFFNSDGTLGAPEERPLPPSGATVLDTPGQREGTIAGTITSGVVTSASVITNMGELRTLTAEERTAFAGILLDGKPQTVQVGELGSYRVILRDVGGEADNALLMGLPMAETESTVMQLTLLVSIAGITAIGIAIVAGALIVRFALRPLDRIAATATQVSKMPLDQGEVELPLRVAPRDADPTTEVGQVGEALNTLLAHVAHALRARHEGEERLRQFVADASHELRTPLASIRGYAELTSRSPHPIPADVQHAIRRIESESIRMSALVEDLLLLARLDDGERISSDSVDLTQLLTDAVTDAQAAAPHHRWRLMVPPEPVLSCGDAMRLYQVVVNLLSNARVHTPEHTLITASVRSEGHTAVLEIQDTGPGIPGSLMPTLFERFVRGDAARSRKTGSTGLGLAIAEAIVHAHGGTLRATSEPGNTVFRLELPGAEPRSTTMIRAE